jgi:NAD(P)-dependent dehydrogenase (short-subunit alcohol dehydrogenase family)
MDRIAVVTGGASGIGEACVRAFAATGWRVVSADLDATQGDEVARSVGELCEFQSVDVAEEVAVAAFVEAVYARHGHVDALVNSAGVLQNAVRVVEMPISEFDRSWSVNVRGSLLVSRAFGSRMCEARAGSIIHLCSLTSFRGSAQVAYAMGKASLKTLTEIMAAEFGPSGVRVNAVAPGYTMTPAMKERIERGERNPDAVIEKSALRRFVEPHEIAGVVRFLCSEEASAITGVTLPIDCGWLAYTAYSSYAAQP